MNLKFLHCSDLRYSETSLPVNSKTPDFKWMDSPGREYRAWWKAGVWTGAGEVKSTAVFVPTIWPWVRCSVCVRVCVDVLKSDELDCRQMCSRIESCHQEGAGGEPGGGRPPHGRTADTKKRHGHFRHDFSTFYSVNFSFSADLFFAFASTMICFYT